ncbi:MAG: metallophosphoesterase family protein [Sedimentisphaerales bacterium]|nr:metallophosphoesterase family protein [Sedimentisphaerales bacterium]
MSKRLFLSICILLVFACVLQAVEMRKGPYLYYPGDNTEMTVLWQLHETAECTLEWGLDENYASGTVTSDEYGDDHQHKITIPNLVPGSKYYYQVDAGDGDVYVGTFFAAPEDTAESLEFLAYGDTRSYPNDHDKVDGVMVDAFELDEGYQTFTLLSGDFVGSGTSEEDWDVDFFGNDGNCPNTIYLQANLPINGCVGNHEALTTKTLFPKYWPYPFVDGFYWSFEYGPALFVIVDQYDATLSKNSPQLVWIKDQLENTSKDWKFIVLHEPGYSAGGGHNDDRVVQKLIQPLCVEYGADIVFGGHNHYYARCEVDGVQHLTLGGGGAPLREPEPDFSEYVEYCEMVHHFGKVEINGNTLIFKAIDANNGSEIDSFTIVHESEP